jgi:hypothetical protein
LPVQALEEVRAGERAARLLALSARTSETHVAILRAELAEARSLPQKP